MDLMKKKLFTSRAAAGTRLRDKTRGCVTDKPKSAKRTYEGGYKVQRLEQEKMMS